MLYFQGYKPNLEKLTWYVLCQRHHLMTTVKKAGSVHSGRRILSSFYIIDWHPFKIRLPKFLLPSLWHVEAAHDEHLWLWLLHREGAGEPITLKWRKRQVADSHRQQGGGHVLVINFGTA